MEISVSDTKEEMGQKAAAHGAKAINDAISTHGEAFIVVATGASQFEMLDALIKENIDWSKVTAFHLDEYVGMTMDHPASFRKYLKERFIDKVSPKAFHYINGEGDVAAECSRLADLLGGCNIDVMFCGIGENGHLAFNDPPADFDTQVPYLEVTLDEACRKQQMGEGWFATLDDVPTKAISMSIAQILKAQLIICTVPDARKAEAVKNSVQGTVSPDVPASKMQEHGQCWLFLDKPSASLL